MKRDDEHSLGPLVGEPVADADLAYVWGGAPADKLARRFPGQQRKVAPEGTAPRPSGSPPERVGGGSATMKQLWDLLRS